VSGAEELVAQPLRGNERRLLTGGHDGGDRFAGIRSACAIALHMHQPLIPAGGEDLRTAPLIGNLQYIFEPKDVSDAWFKNTATVADAPAPPEPASQPDVLVADLARLGDLRAAGTLSDAEFAEAKARLLGQGKPE
jgi:hypothetical protein